MQEPSDITLLDVIRTSRGEVRSYTSPRGKTLTWSWDEPRNWRLDYIKYGYFRGTSTVLSGENDKGCSITLPMEGKREDEFSVVMLSLDDPVLSRDLERKS